jgi:hypothetical protein
MSISMAICETECENASCRRYKESVLKVLVKDVSKYGEAAEYHLILLKEDAMELFQDWEGFLKRNRLRSDAGTIYLEQLKDDGDISVFGKNAARRYTGWVDLSKLDETAALSLISDSLPEDRLTEWDMLSFDDMAGICAECEVSWDKGRGCIGSFGPDDSALPAIAQRYGCKVIASIPDAVVSKRTYTKNDASDLLKEVDTLRASLKNEGKLAVSRYGGVLDRLEALARISVKEGCGFRFL